MRASCMVRVDAPCTLATRLDVAIGGAHDAPEIDSGMFVEIFVFDRDQRIAQYGREIVVADDYAPLQRERSDHASVIVVEFGDGTGTVGFEGVDLRQVGGIDQQQTGSRSHQHGNQHEQAKQDAPDQPASADFYWWKIFVERLHPSKSG